ncbi:MAG: Panacea domain-containing protein [Patescibacteria group bacterium]
MEIPIPKLKAIIRYFCTNTNSVFLGKVKLMKLFYFLDFLHVKKYGTPITYDDYINLEHGPIPSKILNLVNSVVDNEEDAILSDTISIERPDGTIMQRIKCIKNFSDEDKRFFSEREMSILEEVCARFGNKTTKATENASHEEAPWRLTKETEDIPYTLAAQDDDCLVTEQDIKLLTELI